MKPQAGNHLIFFKFFLLLCVLLGPLQPFAQKTFPAAAYQHGMLTPLRSCFDVIYQDITVKVMPKQKNIHVQNGITFKVVKPTTAIQLDLVANMQIDSVVADQKRLPFTRDTNAFVVTFPAPLITGNLYTVYIYAGGKPVVAKKAPWDGGFVWSRDDQGMDWIGLACESIGASCWLPCKDHWSDEADSIDMHLQVPATLMGVSNGRYLGRRDIDSKFTEYNWAVKNPINNYNISINIGNYAHITDTYLRKTQTPKDPLTLDYYVLQQNKSRAEDHFKQVHKMLEAFENYFGPYPFGKDGYKLVEAPYWGMEHQSCVAYGNNYENNTWGFDFIIVHESGHEWFANSITARDPGDMWIHESFTTYSEALFVEYWSNPETAKKYLHQQLSKVSNSEPIVGPYDVYYHDWADNDIYYKGSWVLHTLRNVIDNDTLWFNTLKDFSTTYAKQIITTQQVMDFFEKRTGMDLKSFFQQYLYTASLPVFEYKIETKSDGRMVMSYHWKNMVKGFEMPVKATVTKGKFETITPRKKWQLIDLNYFEEKEFMIQPDSYLIKIEKMEASAK